MMMMMMMMMIQSVEGEPHEKAVELLKAAQGLILTHSFSPVCIFSIIFVLVCHLVLV